MGTSTGRPPGFHPWTNGKSNALGTARAGRPDRRRRDHHAADADVAAGSRAVEADRGKPGHDGYRGTQPTLPGRMAIVARDLDLRAETERSAPRAMRPDRDLRQAH